MELDAYLRLVLALGLVLGLIFLTAALLRKYGAALMSARGPRGAARRLQVQEVLQLDPRRRLVLVRHDDREHLLLLGAQGDVVLGPGAPVPRFQVPPLPPEPTSPTDPSPSTVEMPR